MEKFIIRIMKQLLTFLENSYTAYHATENAKRFLAQHGFSELKEYEAWNLKEGGKYFVTRNGASLIAFTFAKSGNFKIIASHNDSCCLKLKRNPEMKGTYTRLNAETYGVGLWYTFFDRPLRLAGRLVKQTDTGIQSELFVSEERYVIPSLAIHMNRDANANFSPNPQTDLLPLYALGEESFDKNALSYDIFVVPDEKPFVSGKHGEFISSPRIDNLTSIMGSLQAIAGKTKGVCVAACFDSEEIGNGTRQGAASDFMKRTLERIALAQGANGEDFTRRVVSSFLISLDNAHAVHPNHPEKCDPTNEVTMGGGVVIKAHANGAYTTDALTAGIIHALFEKSGVKCQTFFNRSDTSSGRTLGGSSFIQLGIPSVDLGLPQLAMHSATETLLSADYEELKKALSAFYQSDIVVKEDHAEL